MPPNRQVHNSVNVEPATRINSEWTLGRFKRSDKTDCIMALTHSKQGYQTSYYEKDASLLGRITTSK